MCIYGIDVINNSWSVVISTFACISAPDLKFATGFVYTELV